MMARWWAKRSLCVHTELSVISPIVLVVFLFIINSNINTGVLAIKLPHKYHTEESMRINSRPVEIHKNGVELSQRVDKVWRVGKNDLLSNTTTNTNVFKPTKSPDKITRPNSDKDSSKKQHKIRHRNRHKDRRMYEKDLHSEKALRSVSGGKIRKTPKRMLRNHTSIPRSSLKNDTSHQGSTKHNRTCSTCGLNAIREEETVKNIRIQMFIKTLADKLRVSPEELMSKRRSKPLPKLPSELLEQAFHDSPHGPGEDEFYAKDERIIFAGHDMRRNCISRRTSGCYSFELDGRVKDGVSSVQLWVYKNPDRHDLHAQTFFLYGLHQYNNGSVRVESLLQRHETHVRKGWVVINISSNTLHSRVKQRHNDNSRNIMIAVRCVTCASRNHRSLYGAKHKYKPLLVVESNNAPSHSRQRRDSNFNCNPLTDCCMKDLVVNFLDIGMAEMMPREINVNYCFGDCTSIAHYTYNHTMVKQHVRNSMDNVSESLKFSLKPCCVPVELQGAVVFLQSNGALNQVHIPNLIVTRCGCT